MNDFYFRCHDAADLMTKSTDTASFKNACARAYLRGFGYESGTIETDAIRKGLGVESQAIAKICEENGITGEKNELQFNHDSLRLRGTPDLVDFERLTIFDAKAPETAESMIGHIAKENKDHYWQGIAYMSILTGFQSYKVCYVLLDTPDTILNDILRRMAWKMGAIDQDTPEFIEAAEKIKSQHSFERLPASLMYFERVYTREEMQSDIEAFEARVRLAEGEVEKIAEQEKFNPNLTFPQR
jgi:hypothetical protein